VIRSGIACPEVQKAFEKNWSIFQRGGEWRILYKLSPLESISTKGDTVFDGIAKQKVHPKSILDDIVETFKRVMGYNVEVRNRTSPVGIGNDKYLCLGGLVVDWQKTDSTVNNLLVPGIASGESDYSDDDRLFWSEKYIKLYLSFFFVFRVRGSEISVEAISSFFQLPSKESPDDLVVFPTTLSVREKSVIVTYGVADDRSYISSILTYYRLDFWI
jgi:hypothetical protein